MLYKEITEKIIGAAMEVHRTLGNGFQEVVYQRALAIELSALNMVYEREKEMIVYYKDHQLAKRRVDFFVENKIMVELKAVVQMDDDNLAQAMNYTEAHRVEIGLLINFGAKSLQFKRVHNNKIINRNSNQSNQN